MPFMITASTFSPLLFLGMSISEQRTSGSKNKKAESKLSFAETFLKMAPVLRRIIQRILLSKQDTEDLLQEAFICGMSASQKREIKSIEDYLFIITRNLALKERAKQKNNLTDILNQIDDEEIACEQPLPEEQTYSRNRFNAFIHATNTLPEQCKRAFLLRHLYGYSQKDIAHAMNISESTVEKHLAKGLRRCAWELEQLGYNMPSKKRQGGENQ